MTQSPRTIVTHAGAFHADEIMAIALLERFFLAQPLRVAKGLTQSQVMALLKGVPLPPEGVLGADGIEDCRTPCRVIRTRDPNLLAAARENPDVFVLDVGGELEPHLLNFDHHQGSMQDTWPDGAPLSSTGLVWLWLKEHGHLASLSAAVQEELESALIRPLDAHDNGLALCHEGEIVGAYNRSSVEPEMQLDQFEKALGFLREQFDNAYYLARVKVEAKDVLAAAWQHARHRGDRYVVLPDALGYHGGASMLKELSGDQAELLAIPGAGNRYSIISVPIDTEFSIKCPMPEEWRGKMDQVIETGGRKVKLVFTHKNGFMCVIEGSAGDAHALSRHIVEHNRARPVPSLR